MSHAFLLSALLERLREADFAVAPDDVIRAVAIVSRAEHLPAARLETLLGPLFAKNREEQERFGRIFRKLIAPAPAPALSPATVVAPRRNVFRIAFVSTLAVLVFVIAVVRFSSSDEGPDDTTTSEVGRVAQPKTEERTIATFDPVLAVTIRTIALAAILALIVAFVAWLLLTEWRRRHAPSRAPEVGPPYRWDLATPPLPVLFPAEELARLSRALRGKAESESVRLDVPRTIAHAARRPAEPQLVYAADLVTPEYVVLIEKRSDDDHQAAYFDRLTTLLAADGVSLRRHFFEYDPRVCWTTTRARTIQIADIRRRAPSARLLLFGGADALFHPVTGAVDRRVAAELRWPVQVMVTPDELPFEGVPGLVVAGGADLMEEVADVVSGGYRLRRAPRKKAQPLSTIATAREAKARLSPAAFRWLCACAAHPRLQWELTIALGAEVCASELASALRELVALPWFRSGEIPEAERVALVEELRRDGALERTARRVILAILEKTEVPAGSFAARDRELQLLAQRIWLDRHDASKLRALFVRLQQFRLPEIGRDVALVKLLLAAPGTRVAKRIPAALRKYWFRFGMPAMGRHPIRGGAEVFLAGALVLAMFPYDDYREPTGESERGSRTITVPVSATDTASATDTGNATATDTTATATETVVDTSATTETTATEQTTDTSLTTTEPTTDTSATTATSGPATSTTQTTAEVPCELAVDNRDCKMCLISSPFGDECLQWINDANCELTKVAQNASYKVQYEACREANARRRQIAQLEENELIEPANGAVLVAEGDRMTVRFRWTKEGVYRFFVTDENGRDVGSASGSQVAGTFFDVSLPPGTYGWHLELPVQLESVFRESRFTVVNEITVTAPIRCGVRTQFVEVMLPFAATVVSARHGDQITRVLNAVKRDGKDFVLVEHVGFSDCKAGSQFSVTLTFQVVPRDRPRS